MKSFVSLLLICLSAALVRAQTQTIVDPAGETVVIVVTLDPALGVPTTETIDTLADTDTATTTETTPTTTTTTPTTTSSSTTTTLNQGPIVGQPPATTAAGDTTFQYTTTDALGNTQVLTDVFTASTARETLSVPTFEGTVLDYSSWLGVIGTNTVAAALDSSSGSPFLPPKRLWAGAAAFVVGTLGGAWLTVV